MWSMDKGAVQFVGNELGRHGPNVYFKEFSVSINGEKRNYKLGDFYFVQKDPAQPICIAEFQLIWMNLKDGKKLAAVKLYFRPEDTKPGRLAEHGEDELMEADRHIPIYCDQMPSWECNIAIPFGRCIYKNLPATNELVSNAMCREADCNCTCYKNKGQRSGTRTRVKVLSFPAYCRYRATMKLIQSGFKLPYKMIMARGAVDVDCCNTKILFTRFKFQHSNIDNFVLAENIRIPVFKGRPRKRRQSRTKLGHDVKKVRVEKENSNPDANMKVDSTKKEGDIKADFKSEDANVMNLNQTYRIVAPPANCNPERNVIHVKIENKKIASDFYKIKDVENEDMKIVIKTNGAEEDCYSAENENKMCWDDGKIEEGSIESPQMSGEEHFIGTMCGMENELTHAISPGESEEEEDPPSELVKNGKTGTVLDESFFRKMRNEMKASEGVDKEKMRKILVDACKDVDTFKHELFIFMKQRGTPIIYVPKVGYTRVDLPKLFSLVVANGGYRQVTLNHKWKKVYDEMALATTITSAATCMRRHYEKLLLPFERYLRIKHRKDALSSKTYAISAQASQPLVLTIKTIKNEGIDDSDSAQHVSPIEQDQFQSPVGMTNVEFASDYSYKPIDFFDCSGMLNANRPKEKDFFISSSHLAANQDHLNGGIEIFANSTKDSFLKNMPRAEYDSLRQATTPSRVPVIFPYSNGYGTAKHCLATEWHSVASSNEPKLIYRDSEHLSRHDYMRSAHFSRKIPPQSKASAASQLLSSSSLVTSSSPAGTSWSSTPAHANRPIMDRYAKVTTAKQEILGDEDSVLKKMYTPNSSENFQKFRIMRKKRGRPPKHAKSGVETVKLSQSQTVFGGVVCSSLTVGHCFSGAGKYQQNDLLISNQVTVPTPSLKSSRMSTSEVDKRPSKRGAVRVYEYVANSDSPNAKMVKYQQGIIPSFCSPRDSVLMKTKPPVSSPAVSFGKKLKVEHFSNITSFGQVGIVSSNITHCPRMETVTSFASKGCLPSTLMKDEDETAPLPKVVLDNSSLHIDKGLLRSIDDAIPVDRLDSRVDNINGANCVNELGGTKEERESKGKRFHEPRSVITGPPPLVPIDKRKERTLKREEEPDNIDTQKFPRDNEEQVEVLQASRTKPQGISGVEQISFVSDMRAMKESFNVDSIMRPLTKTIDQSLDHFRKVTVNEFDKDAHLKCINGKNENLYVKHHESEAKTLGSLRNLHPSDIEMTSPSELKVEVDRSLTPGDIECKRNYDAYYRQKREGLNVHGAMEDSSQRLLRIVSSDDFEGYSKEMAKYSSRNEGMYESVRSNKTDCSNDNGALPASNPYGRHDLEQRVARLGKYGYDVIQSNKQDIMCLPEKCLYNEPILSSQHKGNYFEDSNNGLHSRGSHNKSLRDKAHEKCMLHRDEYQHADSHSDVHCHRPTYPNEDAIHQREAHHYRDSYHMRKYLHDHQLIQFYHENHHTERGFPKNSPDSNAMYSDGHQGEHRAAKDHFSLYHTGPIHSDFSHHGASSMFTGRMTSPVFERNQLFETSPPSSIRSAWFNASHFPVSAKDCHGSISSDLYWRQKVRH